MKPTNSARPPPAYAAVCWVLFVSGILLHFLGPQLEISGGKFVIPASLAAEGKLMDPQQLVQRERRIQLASAILTVLGAAGLACLYRKTLLSSGSGRGKPQMRETTEAIAAGEEAQ